MSRLAKKPISIPEDMTASLNNGLLRVKGSKGERALAVLPFVRGSVEGKALSFVAEGTSRQARANVGTMWSLAKNAIVGLIDGFSKVLEIEGVGYRAVMEGTTLVLSLGYVNPVRFPVPQGVAVTVEKNVITVTGVDKELVGRVASQIRALKKPEPYKGKGIHYQGEVIRRKVGKKAATIAAA